MKALILLAFFALAGAVEHNNGENGWYIPTVNGTSYWVDKDNGNSIVQQLEDDLEWLFSWGLKNPVKFYLLTPEYPTDLQEIEMNEESIKESHFNTSLPTKFSIHGWRMSCNSSMNTDIALAWFSHGDYNIIVPDWSRARDLDYFASVAAVPGVGKKIANMVDLLHEKFNLDFDTLELIGHSLGAHVCGYTGKNVKGGKINTIVGLDPALPLFDIQEPSRRLCSTDANYVQTIHTCAGKLGFLKPIGSSSFYPNGGVNQPGCGMDLLGMCDHARSVKYYVEAVLFDNFSSTKCADYEDAVNDSCGKSLTSARMGAILNKYRVDGSYYVPVRAHFPFGTLPI